MKTGYRSNLIGYLLLGLLFVVGPFFWKMDVGDQILSPVEAWETGAAKIIVAMGFLLLILAVVLWLGASWSRWLILVWCPISILSGISWSIVAGIGKINLIEFGVVGIPVMLFWVWATWQNLFKKAR